MNRKNKEQRIQQALKRSQTNKLGLTPKQIANLTGKPKKTQITQELRRRIVSRNDVRAKPEKAKRLDKCALQPVPNLLGNGPTDEIRSAIECATPSWLRTTEKADVSVVVPLYKSHGVLKDLINSWTFDHDGLKVELIMVDDQCPNGSKDSALKFWMERKNDVIESNVKVGRIYQNTSNLGFGGACNMGAHFATGDYIIFLNADTIVTPDWIKPMIRLLRKEDVGVVGNLQIKFGGIWNGTIDSAGSEWLWDDMCFIHIGRHTYNHFKLAQPFSMKNYPEELNKAAEREMVTGCCMAFRKSLFKEIGGFDLNYRVGYWEDSEICMSLKEKGYKVMYQPLSKIYHKLGHSASGPHKFHDHNRKYFINKWVNSGRIDSLVKQTRDRKPDIQSILIKRAGAHGDVLMAAAVAPALKKKHKCQIIFSTQCPEVLKDNPYIDRLVQSDQISDRAFSVLYNLDMVYESRPHTNILTAYADHVGVKREDCQLFLPTQSFDGLPDEYVVIHAGRTAWVGRDWEHQNFVEIAEKFESLGHKVICVGRGGDHKVPCYLDLRNQTTIPQLADIIQRSKLFVGIDSFPMHVAQAVGAKGVAFFGSIKPETRIVTTMMKGIVAPHTPCLGCHHRKITPCTNTNVCETGTLECISGVSVKAMWNEIEKQLEAK